MKSPNSGPSTNPPAVGSVDFIPQIQPYFDDKELEQITEVVQSTFITENKKTEEFLEIIKNITGAKYAIAVGNGTLALIATLLAEGIGAGDEVIVPNLTFIASANAVKIVGAEPIFCDVCRETGCMRPEDFLPLVTDKTKCVMPVHLYGLASPMREIVAAAKERGLIVIEDAAEAFGMRDNGQHMGTFGEYGTFSFFANKTITCGEGGVILTNSEARYKKLYRVKNHGRNRKGIFIHEEIGYNFCFTDLQAAIGVAQLQKFDLLQQLKKRNFEFYQNAFAGNPAIQLVEPAEHIESNYWFVNILVDNTERLAEKLLAANIQTRRFFYPLNRQPCFQSDIDNRDRSYPNTNWLFDHGLSIPSGAGLTLAELEYVAQQVIKCVKEN